MRSRTDILPGPLLWHFENNEDAYPSIELDLEEVKELARRIGFELHVSQVVAARLVPSRI